MQRDKKSLQRMEQSVREIGRLIGKKCPDGVGFALLMFDFGEGGFATYISNAQRADMIKALREQADRLETNTVAPHGQPNHPANNPGGGRDDRAHR